MSGGRDEINAFKFIKSSWGKGKDSQSVEALRKLTNHLNSWRIHVPHERSVISENTHGVDEATKHTTSRP